MADGWNRPERVSNTSAKLTAGGEDRVPAEPRRDVPADRLSREQGHQRARGPGQRRAGGAARPWDVSRRWSNSTGWRRAAMRATTRQRWRQRLKRLLLHPGRAAELGTAGKSRHRTRILRPTAMAERTLLLYRAGCRARLIGRCGGELRRRGHPAAFEPPILGVPGACIALSRNGTLNPPSVAYVRPQSMRRRR